MVEALLYIPLVRYTCAFEPEGHCWITKRADRSDQTCLDLIFNFEGDLMIP
jgi:hypothetical protein